MPLASVMFTSAPFSTRNVMTSACPFSAAIPKGVLPKASFRFTSVFVPRIPVTSPVHAALKSVSLAVSANSEMTCSRICRKILKDLYNTALPSHFKSIDLCVGPQSKMKSCVMAGEITRARVDLPDLCVSARRYSHTRPDSLSVTDNTDTVLIRIQLCCALVSFRSKVTGPLDCVTSMSTSPSLS